MEGVRMASAASQSCDGPEHVTPIRVSRKDKEASARSDLKRHRCSMCPKCFDRRDTLKRHMQVHNKNRPLRKRQKKSCTFCSRSKIKCSGDHPCCFTCYRRGTSCIYENDDSWLPPDSSQWTARNEGADQSPSSSTITRSAIDPPDNAHLWTPPEDYTVLTLTQSPSDILQDDLFSNMQETYFQTSTEDGNFSWVFTNVNENQDLFPGTSLPTFEMPLGMGQIDQTQISQSCQLEAGNAPDASAGDQRAFPILELGASLPQNLCGPDDPWPMEWCATGRDRCINLPMLGNSNDSVSSGLFCQIRPISDAAARGLRETLQLALDRTPGPAVCLDNFPGKEKLDHCIDTYFNHFHRILPIIHRPSFDPTRDPIVLTLAIVCIGSCYTRYENAQSFAIVLSELNRRLLSFMSEHDPRFTRTDFYVTAQLLQGTHGYSSGSKRLLELSETFRSSLVNNARNMGLFQDRQPLDLAEGTPEAFWKAWITEERMRRLGWAVYVYDSSVSYLNNKRPSISMSELRLSVPSSLPLWDAASEQAWSALHPWSPSAPSTMSFRSAMRTLFDPDRQEEQPQIGDDQCHLILILTMTRFLWTLKELSASPIIDLTTEKIQLQAGQKDLLMVLDRFLQSPISPKLACTRTALAIQVKITQVVHMAHLYAAGDFMDFLQPILRNGIDQKRACARLKEWAGESAKRVREVAYHSSQVLALIRKFPYNLSLEPFNAFHAGAALWCMAQVLPQEPSHEAALDIQRQSLAIDHLLTNDDIISPRINEWVRDGGTYTIGVFGAPRLACHEGRVQILEQTAEMLGNMKVWGIAQNFQAVITRLMWSEEDKLSSDSMQ